jgi:hypothetical protein
VLISYCTVADARVVENVSAYAKVCLSVSKQETHLRCYVDFHSTNEVEALMIAGSIVDSRVVEYVSVLVSNWRSFFIAGIRNGDDSPKVTLPRVGLGNSFP